MSNEQIIEKRCRKCGETKPLTEFYKDKSVKDGRGRECKLCAVARKKVYYGKNRKKLIAYTAQWQKENPERTKELGREYRARHRDEINESAKQWRKEHEGPSKEYRRNKHRALVIEVLLAYGGICECCGEDNLNFLTLDHINQDGAEHKRELGIQAKAFYRWVKRNGYPPILRILCFNCNCGSWRCGGICPHKQESPIGLVA